MTRPDSSDPVPRSLRVSLRCFALMAIAVALAHVHWHRRGTSIGGLETLTEVQADVLRLLNGCIVLVCLFQAALAFAVSREGAVGRHPARGLARAIAAFWIGRLGLEFLYPIRVDLLGPHTTTVLKAAFVALAGSLVWTEFVGLRPDPRRASAPGSPDPPTSG